MIAKLNVEQWEILLTTVRGEPELEKLVHSALKRHDFYMIEMDDETADILRDKCTNRFQIVGMDETYSLTKEGKILEELIDTMYRG